MPEQLFFLTDDQDWVGNSIQFMPNLQSLIVEEGAQFEGYAGPTCCPSRSSILTGKYPFKVGVKNNNVFADGTGCASAAWYNQHLGGVTVPLVLRQAGPETRNMGYYLQQAGYRTAMIGKYLNQYGDGNNGINPGGLSHVPVGWTKWLAQGGGGFYYSENLARISFSLALTRRVCCWATLSWQTMS